MEIMDMIGIVKVEMSAGDQMQQDKKQLIYTLKKTCLETFLGSLIKSV